MYIPLFLASSFNCLLRFSFWKKPFAGQFESILLILIGTLDGFTFDSDEEAENLPRPASQGDQNENVDDQTNGNVKAKAKTKKASVCSVLFVLPLAVALLSRS